MKSATAQRLPLARLALLTVAAVAVHGYHLGVEDAEIYLPAARKLLQFKNETDPDGQLIRYNSPVDFDPAKFNLEMDKLRGLLPQ